MEKVRREREDNEKVRSFFPWFFCGFGSVRSAWTLSCLDRSVGNLVQAPQEKEWMFVDLLLVGEQIKADQSKTATQLLVQQTKH